MAKRIKNIKFSDHEERHEAENNIAASAKDMGWDNAIAVDQGNEKITISVTANELEAMVRNSITEEMRKRFDVQLEEVWAKQLAFRDFCGNAIDQLDIKDTSEARKLLKIPANKKIFNGTVQSYREEFNSGREEEEEEHATFNWVIN